MIESLLLIFKKIYLDQIALVDFLKKINCKRIDLSITKNDWLDQKTNDQIPNHG